MNKHPLQDFSFGFVSIGLAGRQRGWGTSSSDRSFTGFNPVFQDENDRPPGFVDFYKRKLAD